MKSAGKLASKTLLVLEREVVLGEGHRAGVEPHVDHLGHAPHRLAAACARRPRECGQGNCDLVDVRAVVVVERHVRERSSSSAKEPDHVHVPVRAAPHRQRRAPVALARERPVDVVLQPVAEAPVLDVRRVPAHRLVRRQQLVAQPRTWRCTTTVWRSRAAACRSASSADRSARSPAPAAAGRARAGPRSARCVSSGSLTKRPS